MTQQQEIHSSDTWSRWLLQLRNGADPAFEALLHAEVQRYADRVLDGAQLGPGMTLVDVGAGDGLVALRAIQRIGPTLGVILTDVSPPLLRRAQLHASEQGVLDQCTFMECPAERLAELGDDCVDVITTRAVLAYVADKKGALQEFFRVLKTGGRISLAEPIFQDDAFAACALRGMVEDRGRQDPDPFLPLLHRWKAAQYPDSLDKIAENPLTNFSERTLLESIQACGFTRIHLELHCDVLPSNIPTWRVFVESSPHPWAPPLSSILAERFTAQERQIFENVMRPLVESHQAISTSRIAYFTAIKP